ncbi:23S rRNA (cytidine(2498)-2'-O)-methyltransferase RlmM [Marinomonas ostreistagni]|uniref:23S rRNA (cytidine(2498)-2'-O)-methyltransferase RlmM n=1 Tax=Marinomonas ostreistagni TaxID=359209 RepID=UPI00194FAAC9|nr:23S rRNA (cytidine(2498)-2'-O)-methyltransferase RlmM [Marinomonas ostreistagni]MBM6549834.1 23S rRNA (cytidine(2498)-2'-O)-methyltransferase RlmM [Marinomonas ostreistagni]
MKNILIYCRAGFEKDALAEITDIAAEHGFYGYGVPKENQGFVVYNTNVDDGAESLIQQLSFNHLIFARQIIAVNDVIEFEKGGRVQALLEAARELPLAQDIWLETADTNEAKALSGLIKKIEKPLKTGWKKAGLLRTKAVGVRHHVFFMEGDQAYLGVSYAACRSEFPLGIRRLRFPAKGPSRSTLKLEEALLQFVPEERRQRDLYEGMNAVDLGACPGGWTYQFVVRGIHTYAVDNGPMQKELMDTGLVSHMTEDGFKFEPPVRVDWMVCDMVERPILVAELMAKWLCEGWTERAIFNLKLPMKKRYQEVVQCLELIASQLKQHGLRYEMQYKHLYHDREEITVCVMVK